MQLLSITASTTATVIAAQGWTENIIRDREYESSSFKQQQQQLQQQQLQQQLQQQQQQQQIQQQQLQQQQLQSQQQQQQSNQQLYSLKEHSGKENSFKDNIRMQPSQTLQENEKAVILNLTQRAEYVCQIILCIVSAGDLMAKDTLLLEKKSQVAFTGTQYSLYRVNYSLALLFNHSL